MGAGTRGSETVDAAADVLLLVPEDGGLTTPGVAASDLALAARASRRCCGKPETRPSPRNKPADLWSVPSRSLWVGS